MTPNPTDIPRESAVARALEAYKAVPHNRFYAVDDRAALALGALVAAYAEQRREEGATSFSPQDAAKTLLGPLAKFIPGLVQERPGPEPELPKQAVDPVTGETARNPYKEPRDFASIKALEERQPELAAYLKETAGGLTYAQIAKREDEKAAREKLRKLEYGASQHKGNALTGNDLKARGEFIRNTDPVIVEFYRREASPVELPLDNLTLAGQLTKHAPELRPIIGRAREIAASWKADDERRLRELKATTEAELARLGGSVETTGTIVRR